MSLGLKLGAAAFVGAEDKGLHLYPSSGAFRFDRSELPSEFEKVFVHYLTMNDGSQMHRDTWMRAAFPMVEIFPFSLSSTTGISRARSDFDVLAVGGADIPRSIKFLKDHFAALRTVAKIAVVHESKATKRAKLLTAGFDDVFDVARLSMEEARARIKSIRNRYGVAQAAINLEVNTAATLAEISSVARLSKRERMILLELITAPSRFCSYAYLQSALGDWGDEIAVNNLKVIISNLRKKLRVGCSIISRTNSGYELIYEKQRGSD